MNEGNFTLKREARNEHLEVARARKALIATGKVAEFIDSTIVTLPLLPKETNHFAQIKKGVTAIDAYFRLPVVVDADGAFNDAHERLQWEAELTGILKETYTGSAIRLNRVNTTLYAFLFGLAPHIRDPKIEKELTEWCSQLQYDVGKGWGDGKGSIGSFTVEEKMTFVSTELKPFLLRAREVALREE